MSLRVPTHMSQNYTGYAGFSYQEQEPFGGIPYTVSKQLDHAQHVVRQYLPSTQSIRRSVANGIHAVQELASDLRHRYYRYGRSISNQSPFSDDLMMRLPSESGEIARLVGPLRQPTNVWPDYYSEPYNPKDYGIFKDGVRIEPTGQEISVSQAIRRPVVRIEKPPVSPIATEPTTAPITLPDLSRLPALASIPDRNRQKALQEVTYLRERLHALRATKGINFSMVRNTPTEDAVHLRVFGKHTGHTESVGVFDMFLTKIGFIIKFPEGVIQLIQSASGIKAIIQTADETMRIPLESPFVDKLFGPMGIVESAFVLARSSKTFFPREVIAKDIRRMQVFCNDFLEENDNKVM